MAGFNRTFREVDDKRIEGTWRHAFIRNGDTYFLTDIKIYADGMVDCWDLLNLAEFAERVRSGRIATALPAGGRASAHHLASWTFADPQGRLDAEDLIGEVTDEVDRMNKRPDSAARCREAARTYLADRTADNRRQVRTAYHRVPAHLRPYVLGDMDNQDRPLRLLFSDDAAEREQAFAYFADVELAASESANDIPPDGPDSPLAFPVTIRGTIFPNGWPEDPGLEVLQNSFPAPIALGGVEYPSVTHAYWALSTSDEAVRARIAGTENPYRARDLAESAARRPHWHAARAAVMADLLRAKYRAHPDLADVLVATGDAKIISNEYLGSDYWRPWVATLLELVRSELAAARAGITRTEFPPE